MLAAYQPFLEADLGLKRRLLLSSKRIEWHPRSGDPIATDVSQIARVRLHSRPAWESLAIGAPAFVAMLLASAWLRALLAAVALLAAAACFLQRRYALVLEMRDGSARAFDLGVGTRRSSVVQRIESVWDSLRPALEELGIKA